MALRSFHHVLLQKLGALGIFATSFLAGYLIGGKSIALGLFCASTWLLLPWLEILTRIRNLRLPLEKNLTHQTPPNSEIFPDLHEITTEIEDGKFEYIEDTGWDWEDYRQFFRLFYNGADRTQAAICLIDQHDMAFYYLSVSSRAKDGAIWTTWNYPFSHSLKPVPQLKINRMRAGDTFLQIYESHRSFLRRHGIDVSQLVELSGEQIQAEIQKDLQAQIAHNVAQGVLTSAGEGQIRYSWRGLFFIWLQFLRDLVRLS
jgi:hypothetical protein